MKRSIAKEIERDAKRYGKDLPTCNIARLTQICEECNWDIERIVPLLWLDGAIQTVKSRPKVETDIKILDIRPVKDEEEKDEY